jgi:hypothetical protein
LSLPFGSVLVENLLEAVKQGNAELDLAALAEVAATRGAAR